MTPQQIDAFYEILQAQNPHPVTELQYSNPYTLLVAVVMSAQSTDKGVNKATEKLFPIADTPEKMIALGLEGLKEHIKTVGLYPTKAKNIIALSQMLVEQHGSLVPEDREALEALPGVGRKTANVVLNVVFGHPTMAVDTHIFRVSNRTGLGPGATPRHVEEALLKRTPPQYLEYAHHWLILHGRYTCTARAPKCTQCPLWALCHYEGKGELIPS
jgi:endonuclease-3